MGPWVVINAGWYELWGKLFCARYGVAKICPIAAGHESGPAAFMSRERTSELRQADFGRLASAFSAGRAQACPLPDAGLRRGVEKICLWRLTFNQERRSLDGFTSMAEPIRDSGRLIAPLSSFTEP